MFSTRLLVALVASAAVLAGGTAGAEERVRLRAISTIDVGGAPSSLVVGGGAVWVSLGMDGIARIDPATSRVVARIRPGGAVVALAAGFGSIWALDLFGDRLLRIDPETNEVVHATRVGGLPTGVTVGHGSVWVANQLDTTVSRVSPRTGRVLSTTRLGPGELWPGAIAAGAEGVWLVTGGGNRVESNRPAH